MYALDNIADTLNAGAMEAAREALLLPLEQETPVSQDFGTAFSRTPTKPVPTPKQTPSRNMDAEKA